MGLTGISIRGASSVKNVSRVLSERAVKLSQRNAAAMERVTLTIERDVKKDGLSGKGGENELFGSTGAAGDALASRSGHTRRSIVRRVFTRLMHVVGVVGSPLASFAAHEFGATITGKPLLRIPTKFMKTASGVDRLAGRSARTLPNTRLFRSRAGNLFIWEIGTARARSAGRPVPLYLLKPSVKLRARHMLRNALRKNRALIKASFTSAWATVKRG